jgi:hypothetical protein
VNVKKLISAGCLAFAAVAMAGAASSSEKTTDYGVVANVRLVFPNGVTKTMILKNALNQPFSIRSDDGGFGYSFSGIVSERANGALDMHASIANDGQVVSTPHVVTPRGKTAVIRTGERDENGDFRGTTLELTML